MNGISGFRLPDNGVCLAGDAIEEKRRRMGDKWPWPDSATSGDTRVALTWPWREPGKFSMPGCLVLAVLAPDGKMVVLEAVPFETASSAVVGGVLVEGAGLMLQQVIGWGVQYVAVDAEDMARCALWCDMLTKDASCVNLRLRYSQLFAVD